MDTARLESKIDKIIDDVGVIKTTLAINTQSLQEHVKRTNLLEKKVDPLWTSYKFIGVIVGASFFVAAIVEILGYFKH